MEKIKEQNRIRNIKYREKKKLLLNDVTHDVTVTSHDDTDIDKDLELDRELDKEEINIPLQIKNLRLRYDAKDLSVIDEYMDIIKWTRKNGRIADSVILNIYTEWEKYSPAKVIHALKIYINNPSYHDRKENYCYGIMRNVTAEEIEKAKTKEKPKIVYIDDNPFINRG